MSDDKDMNNQQEKFAQRVAAHLRAREDELSGETRARLSAARAQALAQLDRPRRVVGYQWAGAGAFAVLALAVGLVLNTQQLEQMPDLETGDFLAAQELELLEDLEFAAWVAELDELDEPAQG